MWDFMYSYYKKGLFTDEQMEKAITKGWLTQEKFDQTKQELADYKAAHPDA